MNLDEKLYRSLYERQRKRDERKWKRVDKHLNEALRIALEDVPKDDVDFAIDGMIQTLESWKEPKVQKPRKPILKQSQRRKVFERDSYRCIQCGSYKNLHVDHIVPLSAGGDHKFSNCQTLCRSCNLKKGNKLWAEKAIG